ncbi:MAG: tRNA (adenosine(37)-N6)-threonylcarbamoyltransferase complex transferase subunit TsaD [Calditrichaeota bacterium]|nr:tRNA (adenosine(37)-N6)-threonylcarbamoyltransferase complex transferase subunit TsaD [Calditrichota bacterium]
MLVLGIETSCDETSAALVDDEHILANIIATQLVHSEYGGVVPEFASRAHIKQLSLIIKEALHKAGKDFRDIDGIAVTYGPGLAGSLLIGLGVAKGLALRLEVPWIGINHIEGHILAVSADATGPRYPYVCLVVSGGHTLLLLIEEQFSYKILGRTIDDAAGEAFDKVAKVLNLGYPGGPAIEQKAMNGNSRAVHFPRALLNKDNLDFSFSGLKTSVLYFAQSLDQDELLSKIPDIAASFQNAVVDVLSQKSFRAIEKYNCTSIVLAGGVARNSALRHRFEEDCKKNGIHLFIPAPELCTDNAAMIARAGNMRLRSGYQSSFDLDVIPNLSL